jgi:hypothetical protein
MWTTLLAIHTLFRHLPIIWPSQYHHTVDTIELTTKFVLQAMNSNIVLPASADIKQSVVVETCVRRLECLLYCQSAIITPSHDPNHLKEKYHDPRTNQTIHAG